MPDTKTPVKPPRKATPALKPEKTAERGSTIERTADLSDEVMKSLETGQRAAVDAVRKFIDTVDELVPALEHPSRRQGVLDAAMEMTDRLLHTQYDFLRKVVQSAGKTLGGGEGK